jgi:hypothetical protein
VQSFSDLLLLGVHRSVLRSSVRPSQYIATVKPKICTCFSNHLFMQNTLHVSDGLFVHHQELKTAQTATGRVFYKNKQFAKLVHLVGSTVGIAVACSCGEGMRGAQSALKETPSAQSNTDVS